MNEDDARETGAILLDGPMMEENMKGCVFRMITTFDINKPQGASAYYTFQITAMDGQTIHGDVTVNMSTKQRRPQS